MFYRFLWTTTNRGLILEEETHPCSEIVINIWHYVPAPAVLFHKICYAATKIALLHASFLQGRKRDMGHVFHVHFGRLDGVYYGLFVNSDNSRIPCLVSLWLGPASDPHPTKQDRHSTFQILGHWTFMC